MVLEPGSIATSRSATFSVSLFLHSIILAVIVLVPILVGDALPAPSEVIRTFFVSPPTAVPPPPPPPPPPAAGARTVARAPAAPRLPEAPAQFVAPIEVPSEIAADEPLADLGGVEGGVPGGVEGGIPGGVVGGIVGGLPTEPVKPTRVVRIGGNLVAPKLVHKVMPEYPMLAVQARVQALLILEAQVDTRGHVKEVRILRGAPLFDDAAIAAVKQWRYKPLLLNGEPTEFILTVTLNFNINQPQGPVSQ
jgi:protein TonB